ncbi:MAG: hypothetical protein CMI27_02640 [Opitutae bacterium]|nr:hypothetical protein [Opitutae bacterium]|tara:strand:+ start:5117 stop:5311 length:195 start_codon:yes stop_codon:yes gene_type:complete
MSDIKIGDLVRVKGKFTNTGVFLVLKKGEGRCSMSKKNKESSMMAFCAQGSKKIWLYVRYLEKL